MPVTLTSPNVENYFIGKGIVSVKQAADADYVDVGNVPEFEVTPNVTKLDHFSSRTGTRSKDRSIVTEKGLTLRMVLEELTARNLAMFLLGAVDDADPAAVSIDIFSQASFIAAVKFVGTNDIGAKWTYIFPQVEFAPSSSLNLISEEWGNLELSGEILAQEDGSFGTATGDYVES